MSEVIKGYEVEFGMARALKLYMDNSQLDPKKFQDLRSACLSIQLLNTHSDKGTQPNLTPRIMNNCKESHSLVSFNGVVWIRVDVADPQKVDYNTYTNGEWTYDAVLEL